MTRQFPRCIKRRLFAIFTTEKMTWLLLITGFVLFWPDLPQGRSSGTQSRTQQSR